MVAGEDVGELGHPFASGGGDAGGRGVHGQLYGVVEQMVDAAVAQQAVALLEGGVVADEGVEIAVVALRDDHVHPPAAFFAGATDQVDVLRRGHDERECANVVAQAGVFLAGAAQALAAAACHAEGELFGHAAAHILGAGCGEVFAAAKQHGVGHSRKAFAEAQIVDGVEQVAFAHAVVAQEAVDLGREVERCFGYVLEVCQ